jgi:hydrogenase maturation protease
MARVLVAGIGNIFRGDDGFGVEVVRRLADERLGEDVDVGDFGIRGVHLAFEMASGKYTRVILVDATPRGEPPGTLYAIEPDAADGDAGADAHSLTPAAVLAWVHRIGGDCGPVILVGCEPASVDESIGLSLPVQSAVDGAVKMVRELIAEGA